ncbi:MAG: bifunctional nuclease family protein [Cyanobacteria bacterium J06627_28]
MIEMKVTGIAIDGGTRNPVILLRDSSQRRQLPIFISPEQSRAIRSVLEGDKPLRPMTHDLIVSMMTAWKMRLQRVVIHALRDNTFYAVMTVGNGKEKKEIDARPSDAISVALRVNAPIWVMEEVILDAAMPVDREADAAEKEAFHAFVSDISPADFAERGRSV